MASLSNLLYSEYSNEYRLKYTKPKIYHGGMDLSKRWYVYYRYRDPNSGKMVQQAPIYLGVNRIKDKSKRLDHIKHIRDEVERMLKEGFSPYQDESKYAAASSLMFALKSKESQVSSRTFIDYKSRVNRFIKWLEKKGKAGVDIKEIDRSLINTYLNEVGKLSSSRNRNNTRIVLSAIFSELEEEELVESNFIRTMRNVKSVPKRHRAFSPIEVKQIFEEAKGSLYWYLAHVYYGLFRPVEVVRIKAGHVKGGMIISNTKTFKFHKQIPGKLQEFYSTLDKEDDQYILVKDGLVGNWQVSEQSRREYFTKKFNRLRDSLGFSREYTVYSLRHSAIGKLYHEKRKDGSEDDALAYVRSITAHQTNEAVRKYLREIGYYKIEDWSDLL